MKIKVYEFPNGSIAEVEVTEKSYSQKPNLESHSGISIDSQEPKRIYEVNVDDNFFENRSQYKVKINKGKVNIRAK